jgi:hypothetical protein
MATISVLHLTVRKPAADDAIRPWSCGFGRFAAASDNPGVVHAGPVLPTRQLPIESHPSLMDE